MITTMVLALFVVVGVLASSAGAIVNGTPTPINSRPFQVSLQDSSGHMCGGSVFDATTIVTAAHCLEGVNVADLSVRAGVTNASDATGQDRQVASIVAHPDYAATGLGDVAVLKLASPLTLGGAVQPIALASTAELNSATTATVSGWGAVSENGGDSDQLLQTSVPLVNDATCSAQVGSDARTEVCAGGTGTDSCYGDSGGPLTIETAAGTKLAGIVSWGEECGGDSPGVYAEAPTYANFITSGQATATTPVTPGVDDANSDPATDDSVPADEEWLDDEDWDADAEWSDEDWDADAEWSDEDWDADGEWSDEDWDADIEWLDADEWDAEADGEWFDTEEPCDHA